MAASILLIDDEPEFCVQAKRYLEEFGYTVITETDGNKALALTTLTNPDVVVLDVDLELDKSDGRIICAELCRRPKYHVGEMGIILMSGHYVTATDEIVGFEVGADHYLTKPFEMAQLAAMIGALLRRITKTVDDFIQVDEQLSIDLRRRRVVVDNSEVHLTRLEFDLLTFLAQPANTARTKYELFEQVWHRQHLEDGAIAKCVSLIRKKISPNDTDRYVKTVFGVGYILNTQQ